MAFPFGIETQLRQRLLLAISTSGWLAAAAMGCPAKQPALGPVAGQTGQAATTLSGARGHTEPTPAGQTGGGGAGTAAGRGGVGDAGTPAAVGGAGSGAGSGAGTGSAGKAGAGAGGAGAAAGSGGVAGIAHAGSGGAGMMSTMMCQLGVPARECFTASAMMKQSGLRLRSVPDLPRTHE